MMIKLLLVLILSELVLSQVELIQSILYSKIPPGVPNVDRCANQSLNACENKNCINGTYPPDGYTCQKQPNGTLQVDYLSNQIYLEISSYLSQNLAGQSLTAIQDIIIDTNAVTLTYIYTTQSAWTGFEALFVSNAGPSIAGNFGSILGVTMSSKRVKLSASGGQSLLSIELIFPAANSAVNWQSSTNGDLVTLREISLTSVGLNGTSLAGQVRLVNDYFNTNQTITNKWLEDISTDPGTDKTYLSLACEYYGKLLAGNVTVSSTGFTLDLNSLTLLNNPTCSYLPPVAPLPSPHSGSISLVISVYGILFLLCHLIL